MLQVIKVYHPIPEDEEETWKQTISPRLCRVLFGEEVMSRTATYHTTVNWKGEHWGRIRSGNGPEMDFSAPPDAHGHAGVLTPEDAFVAAVNTCIMMMFIWTAEKILQA